MKNFKSLAGFPESINLTKFKKIEDICKQWVENMGGTPVLLPMVEKKEIFERGIGECTDVVEKEMIEIKNETGLVLRPEGTSPVMRLWNNNGGLRNIKPQIWYYSDFMFRNESPQAGRFKQFKQFGVEYLGFNEGITDIDILISLNSLFTLLKVRNKVKLKINTIGGKEERVLYLKELKFFLECNKSELDDLSIQRMENNPLRVFDSKNKRVIELLKKAPKLFDFLSENSIQFFDNIKKSLSDLNIDFEVDYNLVRGLDYYNGLVFEWVYVNNDKAQSAVAAGGRYDCLSKMLGGENVSAIGFAIGLERLNSLIDEESKEREGFYICWMDEARSKALQVAMEYRNNGYKVFIDQGGRKLVKQIKQADEKNAKYAIIIGKDELANNYLTVKDLTTGIETKKS